MNARTRIFVYGTIALFAFWATRALQHTSIPAVPAFVIAAAILVALPAVYLRIWRQSWITTMGVITSVAEERKPNPEGRRIVVHRIGYEYVVAGQNFTGTGALEFDVTGYEKEEEMHQLRETYRQGASITVYYPRSAPAANSLTRSVQLSVIITGLACIVISVVVIYYLCVVFAK